MRIQKNASLYGYNTFGIDHRAKEIIEIMSEGELPLAGERIRNKRYLVAGRGSNLLFTCDFEGSIVIYRSAGINIDHEDKKVVEIAAEAGVIWDDFVKWCVIRDYIGIENLSYIPGTVGAVPVQNIGAYGIEAKDFITKVRAFDIGSGEYKEFNNKDCRFGYRASAFKDELKGKYLITKVWFRLGKDAPFCLSYGNLAGEVLKRGNPTLESVRQTVKDIRKEKLPDPEITGNAGSFFKNPLVSEEKADELKNLYPDLPVYPGTGGFRKIAAGWLIEKCGWKGKRKGDAGVHAKQALVLVNLGRASGSDILDLSEDIRSSVFEKFGVWLEREVEVIGRE